MHSDWVNGIEILQGRWQYGEKVGYSYPSALEKNPLYVEYIYIYIYIYVCVCVCVCVPLVTKGLKET